MKRLGGLVLALSLSLAGAAGATTFVKDLTIPPSDVSYDQGRSFVAADLSFAPVHLNPGDELDLNVSYQSPVDEPVESLYSYYADYTLDSGYGRLAFDPAGHDYAFGSEGPGVLQDFTVHLYDIASEKSQFTVDGLYVSISPVPESADWVMLIVGMLCVGLVLRISRSSAMHSRDGRAVVC